MASVLAQNLGLEADTVAVASTGVIGRRLDVSLITEHLPEVLNGLGSSPECSREAAKAMMTTDRVIKEVAIEMDCGIRIGAIAKGSGMIEQYGNYALFCIYRCESACRRTGCCSQNSSG